MPTPDRFDEGNLCTAISFRMSKLFVQKKKIEAEDGCGAVCEGANTGWKNAIGALGDRALPFGPYLC
jgi:hypothetical protein